MKINGLSSINEIMGIVSLVVEVDIHTSEEEIFKLLRENEVIIIAKGNDNGFLVIDKETAFDYLADRKDNEFSIDKIASKNVKVIKLGDSIDITEKSGYEYVLFTDDSQMVTGGVKGSDLDTFLDLTKTKNDVYLDFVLNNMMQGFISIDSEGLITNLNKSAEKFFNILGDDVIGKHIDSCLPNSPLLNFLESDHESQIEKVHIDKNVTIVARRYKISINEITIGALSFFEDISNYLSITDELNQVMNLNDELDAIINNSYDGIYITSKDGLTLRVNDAYERITGIKKSDLLGRYMSEIIEEGILSKTITGEVVKTKRITTDELLTKTGKRILITGSPLFDNDNKVKKVLFNVRDITELTNLKEELRKNSELTEHFKNEIQHNEYEKDYVYKSNEFNNCVTLAKRISGTDMSVLITGETGVGKEILAKIIHETSNRSESNFIKINCGAIPSNLLESELFGYEAGAFTGANKNGKMGLFELADKGTIFLDEIGEMPLDIQVKLLRVLQDQEVQRIGSSSAIKVNIRVVAATNRNLENMVNKGEFRSDLYFRLNVISIPIPPLRERRDDILVLAKFFLDKLNLRYGTNKKFDYTFIDEMNDYNWPGNIRELKNLVERAYITSESDTIIAVNSLSSNNVKTDAKVIVQGIMPLNEAKRIVENELISKVMNRVKNTRKAAKILGVSQATISRKASTYLMDDAEEVLD